MRDGKLEQLQRNLADQRSRRVVFATGTGICQMPCPEQRAWGGVAKRWLVPVYGSEGTLVYRLRRPLARVFVWWTRWSYARLARRVAREAADYARSGFDVAGVVGIGASPSCGVWHTMDVGRALEVIAACPVALADASRFNAALMGSARTAGEGMFIRALRRALARRELGIPFAEHDLAAELNGGPIPAIVFGPAGPTRNLAAPLLKSPPGDASNEVLLATSGGVTGAAE